MGKNLSGISALFTDGAILQRNMPVKIFGISKIDGVLDIKIVTEEEKIVYSNKVTLYEGKRWMAVLPAMPAGGPYEIQAGDFTAKDVYFGDVFVVSGGDNMALKVRDTLELYAKEVHGKNDELLRYFSVKKACKFVEEDSIVEEGSWVSAQDERGLDFSAVAYFFAEKLRSNDRSVPVGIIDAAAEGTFLHSFVSRRHLTFPDKELIFDKGTVKPKYIFATPEERYFTRYKQSIRFITTKGYLEALKKADEQNRKDWNDALEKNKDNVIEEGIIRVPGLFLEGPLDGFVGGAYLSYKFTLSKENLECAKNAENSLGYVPGDKNDCMLSLGIINDEDIVYINGTCIGSCNHRFKRRIYKFSSELLHEGENEIKIDLRVHWKNGGFVPDKNYRLIIGSVDETDILADKSWLSENYYLFSMGYANFSRKGAEGMEERAEESDKDGEFFSVDLSGLWNYTVYHKCQSMEYGMDEFNEPSGVFNAMIRPLAGLSIRAVVFYGGENDLIIPDGFEYTFESIVRDFRDIFTNSKLPFIYVQLADFANCNVDSTEKRWSQIQQKQVSCQKIPFTKMVAAADLGEYNDMLTAKKKPVGLRVAAAIEDFSRTMKNNQ